MRIDENRFRWYARLAAPRGLRVLASMALTLCMTAAAPVYANGPNLLANPTFDVSLAGWDTLFASGAASWSRSDAGGSVSSGSLRIIHTNDTFIPLTTEQCVPVVPGTTYTVAATVWIASGSNVRSRAAVSAAYFLSTTCEGNVIGFSTSDTKTQGKWVQLADTRTVPGAQSALIILSNDMPESGPNAIATTYHDNVYFGTGACAPGPTNLCLNQGRFKVQATWKAPDGTSGPAWAIPSSGDSGSFWFFADTNVELDVKVLNACIPTLGNRYWVFAAGLTNVQVTLTVTDTQTGAVKNYNNQQGTRSRQ